VGGFEQGGWQMTYFDDAIGAAVAEGMAEADGFLLGRKTYEIFAAYWPSAPGDEGGREMNSIAKFVISTTLEEPLEWNNSTLLKGDLTEEVTKLKQQPGKNLVVVGSGGLAHSLTERGLVDEYNLMIHPIVLGSGKRLFEEGGPRVPLKLIDSKTTSTGVLMVAYQPEGS
jgi:dihydrofolate reductase